MFVETKTKALVFPSKNSDAAFWRILWPSYQMQMEGGFSFSKLDVLGEDAFSLSRSDLLVMQNEALFSKERLKQIKEQSKIEIVCDLDCEIDDCQALLLCDRVSVPSQELKTFYGKKLGEEKVFCLPYSIPYFWAGMFYSQQMLMRGFLRHKEKPRVLFFGEEEDLKGAKEICDLYHWVFVSHVSLGLLPRLLSSLEGSMVMTPRYDEKINLLSSALGLPYVSLDGDNDKFKKILSSEEIFLQKSVEVRQSLSEKWLERDGVIKEYKDYYRRHKSIT